MRRHLPPLLALAAALLAAAPLRAQVLDALLLTGRAREPVYGAEVVLLDPAGTVLARAVTQADGRAILRAPRPGEYRVRAQRNGEMLVDGTVELVAGESTQVQMLARGSELMSALRPDSAVALDPLVAEAASQRRSLTNAGFYDRQRVGSGIFLSSEQFRQRTGARIVDRLMGLRSIYARPAGASGWVIYQYGPTGASGASGSGRRCVVFLWIDGMLQPSTALNNIRAEDVEGVEVYSGDEVPLRFSPTNRGGRAPCGAIVMWLKAPTA